MDLIVSPAWFFGKDIVIDGISALVLALIAYFSFRYYKLNANRNYLKLGVSFCIIALAFFFKMAINSLVYYRLLQSREYGIFVITRETLEMIDTAVFAQFFLYHLLTLIGLYLLYTIYQRQSATDHVLNLYFILLATVFSIFMNQLFRLTALVLLGLITVQHMTRYREHRRRTTLMLASSFGVIAASQALLVFARTNSLFYVVGELIQLVGYAGLLLTFILVLRHAKKDTD